MGLTSSRTTVEIPPSIGGGLASTSFGSPKDLLTPRYIAWILTAGVLIWSYLPNLATLAHTWSNDSNYTHGYLVIPIAIAIFWSRPTFPPTTHSQFSQAIAWGSLVFLLALRVLLYELSYQWAESATLIPTVACLIWTYGGWPLILRAWPAIVFLIFLLPLPTSVNNMVSMPMQKLATVGSSFLLQLSGLWVIPEGNIINIKTSKGLEKLEVATVCNGLSMLMSLAAVVIATISLIQLPLWKRLALLASVLPIALFSNIIRIVTTGWCYYLFGGEHSRKLAHDWAGFLMMPQALGLVFFEMVILSWLADEKGASEEVERIFLPGLNERNS